jgi:hypothetical protein
MTVAGVEIHGAVDIHGHRRVRRLARALGWLDMRDGCNEARETLRLRPVTSTAGGFAAQLAVRAKFLSVVPDDNLRLCRERYAIRAELQD